MATIPNVVVQYPSFVIEKEITSSAIKTASATTILSTQGNGLLLEGITLSTDATGLAGGTNFVISSDSSYGAASAVFTEAVANLGAKKTVNTGSVASNVPFYVPAGNVNFKVQSTVADCSGAGVIKVLFRFRKLDGNSTAQIV